MITASDVMWGALESLAHPRNHHVHRQSRIHVDKSPEEVSAVDLITSASRHVASDNKNNQPIR